MRYLVLSDIHGNIEALEAVLSEAPAHDSVICLGDIVGYGASPNECAALVRSLNAAVSLVGNHDLAALGKLDLGLFNDQAAAAAAWTGRLLEQENREWLQTLGSSESMEGWYMAHASPRDPVWEYLEVASQGAPNFAVFEQELCFVGHTHVPRIVVRRPGKQRTDVIRPAPGATLRIGDGGKRIVNPGAVGQPRDRDPRAAYGLFDADTGEFRFWRAPYDIARSQRKIRDAGLPESLATRLQYGV